MAVKKRGARLPNSTESVRVQVVLPPDIYEKLAELAKEDNRAVSGYCAIALAKHVVEVTGTGVEMPKTPAPMKKKRN